jgi:hypothetical protein
MYKESTEFFQYMSLIDDEKLGFKKLIELKEVKNDLDCYRDSMWS